MGARVTLPRSHPISHHRGPRPNLTTPDNPPILVLEVTQATLTNSILVEAAPIQEGIHTRILEQVAIQQVAAILRLVATPINIQEEEVLSLEGIPTRILEQGVSLISIQVEVGTALVGIQQLDFIQ